MSSLFLGTEYPKKNSSWFRPSGKPPAEVISILSGNISNFGGTSPVKSLCTKALMIASRRAIISHRFLSTLSFEVILVEVGFSNSILSKTRFAALIKQEFPYSLFSIRSVLDNEPYLATLIEVELISESR